MNRPIKFRGRVINRKAALGNEAEIGDLVTGSLIIYEEEPARRRCWIKRQEKNHVHIDYPVDEDSIAQLVGYDANGNEIYEGDYVYVRTNRGNITFKPATMIDIHLVHTYKLKETSDNA